MIQIRKSEDRGHSQNDWLDSYNTFTFSSYQDPNHMGFRYLRVINEDHIQPGKGFQPHGHEDMEIISYVLSGALAHKDSEGNAAKVVKGDVQLMSAGRGIEHSEFNPSSDEVSHFLQMWILPREEETPPRYEEKYFSDEVKKGRMCLVLSPDGAEGSITVGQDVKFFASLLDEGQEISYDFAPGRYGWLQVASGGVELNGESLKAGDGAAISQEKTILIRGTESSEFILFELP